MAWQNQGGVHFSTIKAINAELPASQYDVSCLHYEFVNIVGELDGEELGGHLGQP